MRDHRQFAHAPIVGIAAAVGGVPPSSADDELAGLSATEASDRVRRGEVSAVQLTAATLRRIAIYEPKLNSMITVAAERAMREAEMLDTERRAGKLRGPLHGITLCLKDNIDTAGIRTTAGSAACQDRVPAEDSTIVSRLRAAGAIIIGKNNMNEFAADDGHASFFGRVRNPWALDRETGGSSSGTAAAISADLAHAGIGNDTGGSVRNPAAMCGIVGLKPTSGLVPNRGGIPLSPSLDAQGPMTKTVADTALLLGVIAGYDELDITSEDHPREDYVAALGTSVSGLRIGLPAGRFDQMEPDVSAAIWEAIAVLRGLVAGVREVSLPPVGPAMSLIPFGETYLWHREMLKSRRFLYSSRHRALMDELAGWKAVDFIEADAEMRLLRRTINHTFTDFDLIVQPSLHIVARPLELAPRPDPDMARAPGALFDAALYNILGIPAISLPCGFSREGLPIGLCIAGPRFADSRVLALAHAYEQATEWHKRRPTLTPESIVPPIPMAG